MAGEGPGEYLPEAVQPPQVADEDEESGKGAQQGEVDAGEHLPVGKKQEQRDARRQKDGGDELEDGQQAQRGPHAAAGQGPGSGQAGVHRHRGDVGGGAQEDHHGQAGPGQEHVGGHEPAQLAEAQVEVGVQVEVLRVAHGGEHAAQVGGQGLENGHRDEQALLPGHAQHHHGEGDEGDQGDVVGDDHAEKEGQKDQHQHHLPGGNGAPEQVVPQKQEQPRLLTQADHRHQAEEEGQGVPVDIAQIGRVGGDKTGGEQGQGGGRAQHRLPPGKLREIFDCVVHRIMTPFWAAAAAKKRRSRRNKACSDVVEEGGFEPPKRNATDLQSAPFGHSGTPPYELVELVDGFEPPTC